MHAYDRAAWARETHIRAVRFAEILVEDGIKARSSTDGTVSVWTSPECSEVIVMNRLRCGARLLEASSEWLGLVELEVVLVIYLSDPTLTEKDLRLLAEDVRWAIVG